jgi:hypothetical protein
VGGRVTGDRTPLPFGSGPEIEPGAQLDYFGGSFDVVAHVERAEAAVS